MSTLISRSIRIAPLAMAMLSLAACGDSTPAKAPIAEAEERQRAHAEADGRIECAVGEGTAMRRDCTVEQIYDGERTLLTVRRPDGGFHRFVVTSDGTGVAAADGAEEAVVRIVGDGAIEVAIADARYRLPARMDAAQATP